MKPTFSERQELRKQFANDVDRMRLCLQEAGFEVTDDEAVQAWAEYSDDNGAGWLVPSESDVTLREILVKYVKDVRSRAIWRVTGAEATDGSGDFIVPLPLELSEQLGWKIGDELSIERVEPAGSLRLRRV